MLYREVEQGKIAITQPMHAWLAGQLARAWGNERFGDVAPWEEVCLGAEQHDVGHTAWEQAPTLNPQTGLPHSFLEMPRQLHVQLWSQAARCVLPQGRYAALLVWAPWHSTLPALRCGQRSPEKTPEPSSAIWRRSAPSRRNCLPACVPNHTIGHTSQKRSWSVIDSSSGSGMRFRWPFASVESLHSHRQEVPTATSTTTLTLTALDGDPSQLMLTPWPFRRQQVILVYEGRYLKETFSDEAIMRQALSHAPWVTLQTVLLPGETA